MVPSLLFVALPWERSGNCSRQSSKNYTICQTVFQPDQLPDRVSLSTTLPSHWSRVWEGEGGILMWNREVSHQSPGIISELVQRSLLLPTWLLKHWDNALINRWSPMEPETAAHFYSQEPEIGHVCVCTTLCKRTRACKEVGLWDFPSALATWNAKELLQTMEVLLLAICLQLECCPYERDG